MKKIDNKNQVRFLTFMGCTIFAAIWVALSQNLFTMLIGYEMLTLLTVPLIAHHHFDRVEVVKYIKILLSSSLGLFMPFTLLVYYFAGSVEFKHGGILPQDLSYLMQHLLLFLMFFGIAKTAMLPLYGWLTSAMIAPYPVSALLHAVAVVKVGLFCVLKIIIYIFGLENLANLLHNFNWPLMVSSLTLCYASYRAVSTGLIKHVLAYSTIANLSLVMISFFILSPESMRAGITHMIAHGFTKITLFFAAGIFFVQTKSNYLMDLKGSGHRNPIAASLFVMASLSLIGVPLLAGGSSKALLWNVFVHHKYAIILKPLLLIYTVAVIFYMGKLCYLILSKNGPVNRSINISGMEVSIILCGICMLSFGIVEKFLDSLLWNIL
jgi:multicomponent Na+:H+ antiporter subunit D